MDEAGLCPVCSSCPPCPFSLACPLALVDLSPPSLFAFLPSLSSARAACQRWSRHTCPSRAQSVLYTMFVMLLAMLVALLAIPCVLAPEKIWKAFTDGDDGPDYTLHDVNLVSLRASLQFFLRLDHIVILVAIQETPFERLGPPSAWQNSSCSDTKYVFTLFLLKFS